MREDQYENSTIIVPRWLQGTITTILVASIIGGISIGVNTLRAYDDLAFRLKQVEQEHIAIVKAMARERNSLEDHRIETLDWWSRIRILEEANNRGNH